MPLYLAAFCIFLACKRANIVYGSLCAVATVGVMFAFSGLSVKWFLLLVMFAPYGIIASFIHKYNYFKLKSGLIRGLCAVVYFNVTFGIVYLIASRVLTGGLVDANDIQILAWVNTVGGYAVLALIATAVLVPLDFVFSALSVVVLKRIPAPVDARRKSGDAAERPAPPAPTQDDRYDIFGYEITDNKGDGDKDDKDDKKE